MWFRSSGLTWHTLPHALRFMMRHAGPWGPLSLLAAHVLRTFLLVPSTVLEVAAGSLYGPVYGALLNVAGINMSATIAFWIGRFLGRGFLSRREHGWLKRYDEALTRDGFFAVLMMRLLFVQIDIVSYGAGMTGISFLNYALGTFLGTLPAILAFTIVGHNLGRPRGFLIFVGLSLAIIALVFILKRLPWTRSKLFHE